MWLHVFLYLAVLLLGVALRISHVRGQALQARLRQARRQRKEVMDFLSLFSTSLSTVSDMERALELVSHYLCDVVDAESLCIFRVRDDGASLQANAVAGMFPPLTRWANMVTAKDTYSRDHLRREVITFGEGVIGQVAQQQQGQLIGDAAQLPELERLPRGIVSLMAVPMLVENRLLGVVCAVNCKQPGRHFTENDLRNLEHLSYQAALATNLIGIYAERSNQQRIFQELDLARQIQKSLLPAEVPAFGDFQIHAYSNSALEVGGDFYDFIRMDDRRMMVVIADASGKGVPACMIMAMCQSFCRAYAERYAGLENFLRDLNRHLYRESDRGHYVTMAVLVVDQENGVCEYARAGHTELLVRMPNGITRIIKPKGAALGLLPAEFGSGFDTLTFSCPPGTALMLFTDGITEALSEDNQQFGLDRLYDLWKEAPLPPERMAGKVLAALKGFTGAAPQTDDQTMLLISLPDPAAAEPEPGPAADGTEPRPVVPETAPDAPPAPAELPPAPEAVPPLLPPADSATSELQTSAPTGN